MSINGTLRNNLKGYDEKWQSRYTHCIIQKSKYTCYALLDNADLAPAITSNTHTPPLDQGMAADLGSAQAIASWGWETSGDSGLALSTSDGLSTTNANRSNAVEGIDGSFSGERTSSAINTGGDSGWRCCDDTSEWLCGCHGRCAGRDCARGDRGGVIRCCWLAGLRC